MWQTIDVATPGTRAGGEQDMSAFQLVLELLFGIHRDWRQRCGDPVNAGYR